LDYFPKPDLVAPGNKIVSVRAPVSFMDTTYPLNQVQPSAYGASYLLPRYFVLSGTSMAAPLVSGAVALMLQKNPRLTPNTVKAALMVSARRMDLGLSPGLSRLTQGSGVLNVPGALEIAARIRADAPRGAPWLSAPLSGQSTQQGASFPWAGEVTWG